MARNRFLTASVAASMLLLTATGARTRPVWMPFDARQTAVRVSNGATGPNI